MEIHKEKHILGDEIHYHGHEYKTFLAKLHTNRIPLRERLVHMLLVLGMGLEWAKPIPSVCFII